jgi:hypothetical protein
MAAAMLWQPGPNLSIFFSLKDTNLGAHFLLLTLFGNINFKITLLLKWCLIFDSSPLHQFSKFNNFLFRQFCIPLLKTRQPVLPYYVQF